jgi:hypothetical protein
MNDASRWARPLAERRLASRDRRYAPLARCRFGRSPDKRVLVWDHANSITGHVAIVLRSATWDDQARQNQRHWGVEERRLPTQYLLFCEPRYALLYRKLAWRAF